jgi:hypothetical protein
MSDDDNWEDLLSDDDEDTTTQPSQPSSRFNEEEDDDEIPKSTTTASAHSSTKRQTWSTSKIDLSAINARRRGQPAVPAQAATAGNEQISNTAFTDISRPETAKRFLFHLEQTFSTKTDGWFAQLPWNAQESDVSAVQLTHSLYDSLNCRYAEIGADTNRPLLVEGDSLLLDVLSDPLLQWTDGGTQAEPLALLFLAEMRVRSVAHGGRTPILVFFEQSAQRIWHDSSCLVARELIKTHFDACSDFQVESFDGWWTPEYHKFIFATLPIAFFISDGGVVPDCIQLDVSPFFFSSHFFLSKANPLVLFPSPFDPFDAHVRRPRRPFTRNFSRFFCSHGLQPDSPSHHSPLDG